MPQSPIPSVSHFKSTQSQFICCDTFTPFWAYVNGYTKNPLYFSSGKHTAVLWSQYMCLIVIVAFISFHSVCFNVYKDEHFNITYIAQPTITLHRLYHRDWTNFFHIFHYNIVVRIVYEKHRSGSVYRMILICNILQVLLLLKFTFNFWKIQKEKFMLQKACPQTLWFFCPHTHHKNICGSRGSMK